MTTLYIAGPMSGYPSYNFPAFYSAARSLRACGYEVVSPAEMHTELPGLLPWSEYLRRDLIELLSFTNGVALLPGYERSRGASLEVSVASALGWECKLVDRWIEDVS